MIQANFAPDELEPGPVRHAELSPTLVGRVRNLQLALDEVYPSSLEEWLEDFRRDVHPEREVLWWERLAQSYLEYRSSRELSVEQRQAAFRVLLNLSMGGAAAIRSTDLTNLPEGAIADLQAIIRGRGL
jgi:hypothetical protein